MSLRRLKWLAILAPSTLMILLDLVRHTFWPDLSRALPGQLLTLTITVAASTVFAETIFGVIGRMQARMAKQNRELLALHQAGLDIAGELALEPVLQKVVEQACRLIGARYGALSLLGEGGGIESFLTYGVSSEERARIGPPPSGHGLLSVVLNEGQRLRLADLRRDPRSIGFPPYHPAMRSLLAVPILGRGQVFGNLYLAEKEGAPEFSPDDEETLDRFATHAAIAIENARLHRQVQALAITQERERIAREMHDSLAQVLGYVNTKSQAAQEFLKSGQTERAQQQIGQLAEAARVAYADVREAILGLRMSLGPGRTFLDTLREYLQRWQEQSSIHAELVLPPQGSAPPLAPSAELQVLRIIQEALTNVRKHAGASHVQVSVHAANGWVVVEIEDDGAGFDRTALARGAFPRFGLSTMEERAGAAGGALEIDSLPGAGTRVQVRVPADGTVIATAGGSHARPDRR